MKDVKFDHVAKVSAGPPGREGIPLPEDAAAGDARPRARCIGEKQLLAALVKTHARDHLPTHPRDRDGRAVGPRTLAAIPLPDGAGIETFRGSGDRIGVPAAREAAEEQYLGALRIGSHEAAPRWASRGKELAPLARAAIPFPGVIDKQAVCVEAAEQDEGLAVGVVGHRRT